MNEKLNIQDLIDLLAEKHGMGKENADNFVKEFFLLIEESLDKDKYVKIKGLGTFKLIDVDSRESVNVNTGERFEIQGHTKVSFTPEPTLKDIINRPFSHFETVALNDNTVLDDTPLDNENDDDEQDTPQEIINESSNEIIVEETKATEEAPIVEQEQSQPEIVVVSDASAEETVVTEKPEVVIEEEEEKAVEEVVEEAVDKVEEIPAQELQEVVKEEARDASTMKYFIGIVVFVVVLCGGAVAFMYYPDLLDQYIPQPPVEKTEVAKAEKDVVIDSLATKDIVEPVKADTVTESLAVVSKPKEAPKENVAQTAPVKVQTTPAPTKVQKKPAAAPFEPDSVGYTIVGTETTYTIKEGETLTKVALRFYGTKALWPYIVKHNPSVIKNPDNVPFGTTIKIPKLAKKQ